MDLIEQEIALVVTEILFTHTLMLQDNGIRDRIKHRITEQGDGAEDAVASVFGEMKELLLQSENAITNERAADVEDLMQRLQDRFSTQKNGRK